MKTKAPSSIAIPFIQATGINAVTGEHSLAKILHDKIFGDDAVNRAEEIATAYLRNEAPRLRQSGWKDPAASLFKEPSGAISYVVYDVESAVSRQEIKAIMPKDAEKVGRAIFTPHF